MHLTFTCFQMWFVDPVKNLHQKLKRNQRINGKFFAVNWPEEQSLLENNFVFGIAQTFICNQV